MHILPFYAALLGILFFYLSIRTIGLRRKFRVAIGAGDSEEMLRGMRVHSNFAEYVPISLILIYFVELQGGVPLLIHALGALIVTGRAIHAYGVSQVKENLIFRVSGMAMTFTTILTSSVLLLINFFTK